MASIVISMVESFKRRGVKIVKYEKPEVLLLEGACAAIQSTTKLMNSADLSNKPTTTAYESDE